MGNIDSCEYTPNDQWDSRIRAGLASLAIMFAVSCGGPTASISPTKSADGDRCNVGEEYKVEENPATLNGKPVNDPIETCVSATGAIRYLPSRN